MAILGGWVISGMGLAVAVLAGGALPAVVSISSLIVWNKVIQPGLLIVEFEKFNLINFLAKIVLIGSWMTIILLLTNLPSAPFIASLLINFLAWHLYEAHYYQRYLVSTPEAYTS